MSDETEPKPRLSLMAKLRVIDPAQPAAEGYVIEHRFRDGRWLYKLSLPNPDRAGETFDNWYAEDALDRA
jgi:hypothetical protein